LTNASRKAAEYHRSYAVSVLRISLLWRSLLLAWRYERPSLY
jgi:hypothetical protein